MNNDTHSIAYHPRIYQYGVQVAMMLVHHISIDDEDVPMALAVMVFPAPQIHTDGIIFMTTK